MTRGYLINKAADWKLSRIRLDSKRHLGTELGRNARYGRFLSARPLAANLLTVIAVLTVVGVLSGCGKKGPPEPPSGKKPPAVGDLGYSISATTIKLSWTVPATTAKARSAVAGFLIYRNQEPFSRRECPNCPVIFKQVGDVPSPQAGALDTPLVYTQELQPGYRYIYKVRTYDEDGLAGRDSNFVQFNF